MNNGRYYAQASTHDRILAILNALDGYVELELLFSHVTSVKPQTITRTLKGMVKAGEIVQLASRRAVFPVFFLPDQRVDIPFLAGK